MTCQRKVLQHLLRSSWRLAAMISGVAVFAALIEGLPETPTLLVYPLTAVLTVASVLLSLAAILYVVGIGIRLSDILDQDKLSAGRGEAPASTQPGE